MPGDKVLFVERCSRKEHLHKILYNAPFHLEMYDGPDAFDSSLTLRSKKGAPLSDLCSCAQYRRGVITQVLHREYAASCAAIAPAVGIFNAQHVCISQCDYTE